MTQHPESLHMAAPRLAIPAVLGEPTSRLPERAHHDDAGYDLYAAHDVTLAPGERAIVGTGVRLAIPEGFAGFVHPRSGLAARHGVTTLNSPGTIDAGYRGEVRVLLINTDRHTTATVSRGDRIAQLIVQHVVDVAFVECDDLESTARGHEGFGSTGGFAAASTAAQGEHS